MGMSQIDEVIHKQLRSQDLDIRNSGYRYIDQKVTPDVLAFVADCIVNLPTSVASSFSKNTIWHSQYFSNNLVMLFNKPDTDNETMTSEYDKFIAQPLKSLAFAGVLIESKVGRENFYSINNQEILDYIALRDRNAFNFLYLYLTAVMKRSGFMPKIQTYIDKGSKHILTDDDFYRLKSSFISFMLGHTNINGKTEVCRIFPKVLNIFAVANGVCGTRRGRMTEGAYLYSDLMYNNVNFRDIRKEKGVSRQEFEYVNRRQAEYKNYEMQKVMAAIRKYHYPNSEVRDSFARGEATQVHHIFPKSRYPQLISTPENLILLTAQQHNTKAHPSNRTSEVDPDYQIVCLLSKLDSVKKSVINADGQYSKESYIQFVNTALDLKLGINSSFEDIAAAIRCHQIQS